MSHEQRIRELIRERKAALLRDMRRAKAELSRDHADALESGLPGCAADFEEIAADIDRSIAAAGEIDN